MNHIPTRILGTNELQPIEELLIFERLREPVLSIIIFGQQIWFRFCKHVSWRVWDGNVRCQISWLPGPEDDTSAFDKLTYRPIFKASGYCGVQKANKPCRQSKWPVALLNMLFNIIIMFANIAQKNWHKLTPYLPLLVAPYNITAFMVRTIFASPYDSRQTLKAWRILWRVLFGRTVLILLQNP